MNLKQKTISGLFWSFLSQWGKQISQFIIVAILARLLSPDIFGVIAMAMIFTEFAMIFVDMGIGSALIQKQDAQEQHYSSAFWLNIVVGLILMLLMMISSPFIAKFFRQPELQPILVALSFNFLFSSFTVVQQSFLMKEMEFFKLAIRDIGAVILSGGLGIFMAYNGFGVWSLVIQVLSFTVFNGIFLWGFSPWRPKVVFSFTHIKEIAFFGGNLTGFNITNYFSRNIDKFLIGRFLGAEALGLYSLAYRLMLYPLQSISWVVGRVMFPAFSTIQNDLEKFRNSYLKLVKAISLITFPLMFCLFALTPEFILTVLGEKWIAIIIPVRILCVCGLVQSIVTTVGVVYMAKGRPDIQFKLQLLGVTIVTLSVLIGLRWGINGVALFYTVQTILWTHFHFSIITKLIKTNIWDFYSNLRGCFVASFLIFSFILLIKQFILIKPLFLCVSMVVIGFFMYFVYLIFAQEVRFRNHKIIFSILQ
ncbi:MAG: MOP flippase family protein [Candidatus Gygaella obscura]|nr:MOP flippase family protein [Candidatus Gygaella obscura]